MAIKGTHNGNRAIEDYIIARDQISTLVEKNTDYICAIRSGRNLDDYI